MPESAAPAAPVAPVAADNAPAPVAKPNAEAKPAPKPEPAKLAKPFEINHKGKKVVVDTEEKALHYISKGFGAHESFEAVNKTKAETEAMIAKTVGRLKSGNFQDVLDTLTEQLGDEDKAIELMEQAVYERRVKASQMTPEQKRIAELEAEVGKRKAQEETEAKTKAEKESEAKAESELNRWAKVASDALAAAKVDPDKAPVMLARMRPYIDAAIAAGQDPVGADVLEEFMADERQSFRGMADGMDGAALDEWLGPEAATRLAKFHIERLRAGRTSNAAPAPKPGGNVPLTREPTEKKRSNFWDTPPHRE